MMNGTLMDGLKKNMFYGKTMDKERDIDEPQGRPGAQPMGQGHDGSR